MKNSFLKLFILSLLLPNFQIQAASNYLPGDVMEPWCGGPAYYAKWPNGLTTDPAFFPITVWYQQPSAGYFYKQMGINFYTFWGNPSATTENDLVTLKQHSMSGITGYTDMYLNSVNKSIVKGWFHPQDEPDNAVSGTSDPVPTANIIADYNAIVAKDATRPVFINLGQGAAIDSWYGRGNRAYCPQDYIEYCKGADVISFDVYPMNMTPWVPSLAQWKKPFMDELSGNIYYVAKGVDNLRKATNYKKPIWAFIETTNYDTDPACKLTTVETKAQVWMALIHGARGIGYFVHVLKPNMIVSGVLNDAIMKAELTSIDATIKANAPILNTQTVSNAATVASTEANPVDIMVKRHAGFTYIYAVSMRKGTPTATFTLRDFTGTSTIEVVGENRTITATNGVFQDAFTNWGVHIYKVATQGDVSAVKSVLADDNSLRVKQTANAGEFTIESDENISKIEVYNMSGLNLYSKSIGANKGTIQLNENYKGVLLVKAILNNKTVVRKFIR